MSMVLNPLCILKCVANDFNQVSYYIPNNKLLLFNKLITPVTTDETIIYR